MQILSTILSIMAFIAIAGASLVKGEKMKHILFLIFCGNALYAASYFVGGHGINAAASCCLGCVKTVINYFFDSKNKEIPGWLLVIYVLSSVSLNYWVGGITVLSLLAMFAGFTFVMCIAQKNGARYRFWSLTNATTWCVYDAVSQSYGALVTHIIHIICTVAGMIIHDRRIEKSINN